MARRLEGKVVVVTGSSVGIGRGVAETFASDGANVVVHGLLQAEVDLAVEEIRAARGTACGIAGDVVREETHQAIVEAALDNYGRLDHLVASAGIQTYGDAATTTTAEFDRTFAVNVRGVFLAIRAAIPHLRANGGTITIISSVQAVTTQNNVLAYTSTKGALNAMTRSLAVDEAEYGVRVNAILPGSVDTPMLRASARQWSDGTDLGMDRVIAQWGLMHPLGRVGQPTEIGAVCAFLASSEASFVTGAELRVDGGLLSRIAAALPEKS